MIPSSPGLGGFGSPHLGKWMPTLREPGRQHAWSASATQNGTGRSYESAVVIKERAKESVQKETRGASPLNLIRIARTQYLAGRDSEERGDLKGALAAFIKSVSLAKMAIDSRENERGGVLRMEINEFFEVRLLPVILRDSPYTIVIGTRQRPIHTSSIGGRKAQVI